MNKNDGGPAFPVPDVIHGMTLRDWFAGQAITGLAQYKGDYREQWVKEAYEMADALLEQREEEKE